MFILGIAGGSGSGKSTIVGRLLDPAAGGGVAHLPHDAYYRNRGDMPAHVGDALNWDHPDSLDNDLFAAHIDALVRGETVNRPVYDFATHSRAAETVRIDPLPVLLVEGILLFAVPAIRERLHLKVFIDTPADLRVLRRMVRDVKERGRMVDDVMAQYHATVRPMHEVFVEPGKKFADVVIPWELRNEQAVALLAARVREHIPDEDLSTKAV